mmetsp:Transcript_3971/g.7590  ORF Transcript_3971/g.7590 Transcript_3971/m.7590 type:complete len:84 (-) Transcript_3971:760-1011(-)
MKWLWHSLSNFAESIASLEGPSVHPSGNLYGCSRNLFPAKYLNQNRNRTGPVSSKAPFNGKMKLIMHHNKSVWLLLLFLVLIP